MTHGQVHEEAEHASHHAEDPFAKRVALSMVVIAALLAGVKVLAHYTHNETLIFQIKAGVYQGKANAYETSSANLWSFFQAKKMREVLAAQDAKLLLQQTATGGAAQEGAFAGREGALKSLIKDLDDEKVPDSGKVAAKLLDRAEGRFAALLKDGVPAGKARPVADAELTAARYREEGNVIRGRAVAEGEKAKKYVEQAETYRETSEKFHAQAMWFDVGELAVELGIVLASVAILSKDRRFWYAGMAMALLGALIVALGWFR